MALTKRDKAYLKKVAERVRDSAGRKSARSKKVLKEYREYLERRGYDPDEIANMTRGGAKRWQDETVRKSKDSTRVRYTKAAVYVYKRVVDGRTFPGRWYSHKNYARSVRTQQYWRDVHRLTSIYQFSTGEARDLYKRLHDPKLSLEFQRELAVQLADAVGSPGFRKDKKQTGGRARTRRPGDRAKSMKRYWKTIRRMASKQGISRDAARRKYQHGGR